MEFPELYEVSNFGNIRNKQNKLLKVWLQNSGYFQICFTIQGKSHRKLVHRVVAEAFIPNNLNKPYINHINGNKLDNSIHNLEWVTNSENILHARKTGLNPYNKPTEGLKLGGQKTRNI